MTGTFDSCCVCSVPSVTSCFRCFRLCCSGISVCIYSFSCQTSSPFGLLAFPNSYFLTWHLPERSPTRRSVWRPGCSCGAQFWVLRVPSSRWGSTSTQIGGISSSTPAPALLSRTYACTPCGGGKIHRSHHYPTRNIDQTTCTLQNGKCPE